MKEMMRKVKRFLVDIFSWIRSLLDLIYWFILTCVKSDLKNHIIKESQSKEIDIIVNGPSFVPQIEYVKNNGHDKCMVNMAANTSLFFEIKPKYYCVSDPRFFGSALNDQEFKDFFNNLKRVNWSMFFFVTYKDYKNSIKDSVLEKHTYIKFIPFHSTALAFTFKFRKLAFRLFKKGLAMPNPTSVSIPVIINVINSGYSYINLYGYDQDWLHNVVVDENNQVCLQDTHFYNEKGIYRPWKKNENETFTMYEILQTQTELFESYWFIKEYVQYLGDVKIFNRSPVSLIDAFDRK